MGNRIMNLRIPGMKLSPLYVDNHLLVVVKPAGLLSQADRTGDPDLVAVWKDWIRARFDKPGDVFLGLVHRLDRPVSGVMVLARTSKAARRLGEQFRSRSVRKQYVAVVEGELTGVGAWTDFIRKRDGAPEIVDAGASGARRAALSWNARPLRPRGDTPLSFVDIQLETGRPHQVRLQFCSRGFPLLGDLRYGAARRLDGRNLALHARSLTIEHPVKREPMTFCALPPVTWPDEAVEACRGLFTGRCLNEPVPAPAADD
jgi:23S rRNA-/tRNA-specific pseudouridylate synthase